MPMNAKPGLRLQNGSQYNSPQPCLYQFHTGVDLMGPILHDLQYAWRALRRTRGFTSICTGTLAVGIAANVLVFSVVNAVMLRPLSYADSSRLVRFGWQGPENIHLQDISADALFMLQERARCFQSIAAVQSRDVGVNLSTASPSQYVKALWVSAGFFATVGVAPAQGRAFSSEEDSYGGDHVVVLSFDLWRRSFGTNSVVGRDLRINGEPYKIIGVMPEEFHSYPEADLLIPLQLSPANANPGNDYRVIARLKDGVTVAGAQRELDSTPEYRFTFPMRERANEVRLLVQELELTMVAKVRSSLVLLFSAVIFVLLITCTNLAVLLTVRASARSHEIAIRAALGSSRARLLRLALFESLWIAGLGGLIGIALAQEMIRVIVWLIPTDLPLRGPISIDYRVALFAIFLSLLTALIFGLGPAFKFSRVNLSEMMKQASSNSTETLQQMRSGRALVAVQSGLTLVLVVGAASLLRTFYVFHAVPPGFDSRHVWVAQISLAARRYAGTAETMRLLQKIREQIQADPGVEAVGSVTGLPLENGLNLMVHSPNDPDKSAQIQYRITDGNYFQAMHIPIVAGRTFSAQDQPGSTPAAIVNETLARLWWPGESAIGHLTGTGSTSSGRFSDTPREIVGVSADVHEASLADPPPPTIFIPLNQTSSNICSFINKAFLTSVVVRTRSQINLSESFRTMLDSADSDLSLASFRPLSEVVSHSLARERFYASLITAFGVFALLLTAVGLYGLLSYQLVLRAREMGIRMAVGARRWEVVGLVVRQGVQPVLIGLVAGLASIPFLKRALGLMLYNLTSATFGVFVGAAALLGTVALLTGLLTAVRATAIEPMVVLRTE